MLGSSRYYVDEKGEWWQPNQAYQKGGWGSVGGKRFKLENNTWLPYGTDKNIIGTNNDPVYQTQQTSIQQYRLDVPSGKYLITLHFAELLGGKMKVLPYNLGGEERNDTMSRRVFDVMVNGQTLLRNFNIADEYGVATAVAKSTTITVTNNEGILISFEPVEGEPVLNALQLKRLE
jgi:beta-galactosidase